MKGQDVHLITLFELRVKPIEMNDEPSVFSYHHVGLEASVGITEDAASKLFGVTQRIEQVHHGCTGFQADFFLIYVEKFDESTE